MHLYKKPISWILSSLYSTEKTDYFIDFCPLCAVLHFYIFGLEYVVAVIGWWCLQAK